MQFKCILLLIFFVTTFSANAQQNADTEERKIVINSLKDYKNTPFKKYKIPEGTKLIVTKFPDNSKKYRLEFAGGVTLEEQNGHLLGNDTSGYGAINCIYMINTSIKMLLDKCYPKEIKLIKLYEEYNNKTQDFMVANSLMPKTKEQIIIDTNKYIERSSKGASCEMITHNLAATVIKLSKEKNFYADFRKSMDKVLSIARPPVTNPCL